VGKRGIKIEKAFKSLLGKAGYSDKAKSEIWKWYRTPPKKRRATKKRARTKSSDFWRLHDSMYETGPTIGYKSPEKWRQQ
jgi:hypothetical protein